MSKELTDKWKNGELPSGYYYLKDGKETYIHECFNSIHKIVPNRFMFLAPVPSYEELQKLKEQLQEAINALKDINEHTKELSFPSYTGMVCYTILKKWGVK